MFWSSPILNYKKSEIYEQTTFLELMDSLFSVNEIASNNYLAISMNQVEIGNHSKYDELDNLMKMLGDILEGCIYKNLQLLYCFLFYSHNKVMPVNYSSLNFGGIVKEVKNLITEPTLLNDFIYNIPLNQWRNICDHKDYELITSEKIQIKYGDNKNKTTKDINYEDVLSILKDVNLFNTALKLFFSLIYLDIMPDLSNIYAPNDNIRLEKSLIYLFFNLRTLNFKALNYNFNEKEDSFEMFFEDIDSVESTQDRIIHISQIFPRIAAHIFDDKILNIKPQQIKIYLFYKDKNIANTSIQYQKALDYAFKKINMTNLVNSVVFDIRLEKDSL